MGGDPEVCDGIDNDGNSLFDDGLAYCFIGMPAANTDGATCLGDWIDLDGLAINGCEFLPSPEVCD